METPAATSPLDQAPPFPRRHQKDAIRDNRYRVPLPNGKYHWLYVTPSRRAKWVENFRKMRENGVRVPLTVDHLHHTKADAKRGEVVDLLNRDGDANLYFDAEVYDEESETLLSRCPDVSITVEEDVADGLGNHYGEAITAITLTPYPVVPGQGKWKPVKPNDANGTAAGPLRLSLCNSLADTEADPAQAEAPVHEEPTMPFDLKAAREVMGLPADTSDEMVATGALSILRDAGKHKATVDTLTAERDEARSRLGTAEGQVLQLSRTAKGPELDPDLLDEQADTKLAKLDHLRDTGKITPAQHAFAAGRLGDQGKRSALHLSRKAATHAGLSEPLADTLIAFAEAGDSHNPLNLSRTPSGGTPMPDPRKGDNQPMTPERREELLGKSSLGVAVLTRQRASMAATHITPATATH